MKVLVSLLTLIGLLMLLGVMTNEVYAPPPPNHYTAFEYAEHVLIGKILSVETLSEQKSQSSSDPNDVKGFMLYEIQIDDFLKNPLETNVIKVPGRYATEENPRSNIDPPYEINQKVLLYIQKDEPNRLPNYDLVIRSDESKVIDESISKPYFLSKSDGQVKHYFPLQQFQSGIAFNEIQCKQNLVLIQKYDGTPACVTEFTKQKLIERGWSLSPNNTIKIKKTDLFLNYTMSNGVVKTAQLSDIAYAQFYYETMGVRLKEGHALPTEYSLNLEITPTVDLGSISLQIPKRILDSLENQNDNWIIEIDNGTMSSQSHVKMEQNNSIDINYPAETNHIRIIGSVLE